MVISDLVVVGDCEQWWLMMDGCDNGGGGDSDGGDAGGDNDDIHVGDNDYSGSKGEG